MAKGDFNGDGFGDLAVGVPYEDVGSVLDAGAVNVIFGSANGLVSTGHQFLHQNVSGVEGVAESNDNFGWAVASGDFNGDGFSDLAVGVPNEDTNGLVNVGGAHVFYGFSGGLSTNSDQYWDYQDVPASTPALPFGDEWTPRNYDQWGYSLVWADFNGDAGGDLAIGIPNADVREVRFNSQGVDNGAVVVLYAGFSGLSALGARVVGFGGGNFSSAGYGLTLTAGDYNGDGYDDLAIGAPLADAIDGSGRDVNAAGHVRIFLGTGDGGFTSGFVYMVRQDGVVGTPEAYDQFGSALASGDFNGDRIDDLAVGVPFEDTNAGTSTGFAHVFFGAPDPPFVRSVNLSQVNVPFDGAETGDRFGWSLAMGDFNGDGVKDLAIGVPGEDVGSIANAGIVQIVYGAGGPAPQAWSQNSSGIVNTAESGDQFGYSLSAWNFGRGAQADLAVGVPFEDVFDSALNTIVDAGGVQLIYGTATGLGATGNQLWTQNNLPGDLSEAGDQFGRAVY